MVEFHKTVNTSTDACISFEVDTKTNELEIESDVSSKFETERHTYRINKADAEKLSAYLNEWLRNSQE